MRMLPLGLTSRNSVKSITRTSYQLSWTKSAVTDGKMSILDWILGKVPEKKQEKILTTQARELGLQNQNGDHPRGRSRPHGLDTSKEDRPKDRERFCSVGESYDDSFSHSYHDGNRSRHMKRRRDNESSLSSVSRSDFSDGRYRRSRSKRHKSTDEDDLTKPWMREEEDPFTPRIRNFESSRRTRMPNNVKTYDGTGDPEDHVKIFRRQHRQLQGSQSGIPGYFMQQKKYVKDPVEIHNIKQKDGETIEDFMERFKVETGRLKGAPECMRIFEFMHRVNNPELTKRINEHVPKTMEEIMITTTVVIRGEAVAASKKKGTHPGRHKISPKGKTQIKGPNFRVTQGKEEGLTGLPPLQGRQKRFLRPKQIEELVRAEKLSHLIKDFKHGRDQSKTRKKETTAKDKPTEIYMLQSSLSPYNGIIGRPGIREIQAVPFTVHGMLKFPVEGGIVTIRSTVLIPTECTSVITSSAISKEEGTRPDNFKVTLHPNFPDHEVAIGGTLSDKGRTELCSILKKNLDIFAWKPSDMTGVPRLVAEHRLNIREGYSPVRKKKRGQAPERAKAIQAEVQKLVEAGIVREVYYHDWLSNPVMVKKHDKSWRMCVDFTDLNKACPQDCYPIPEIDWKVESLCGYPFKCFLDAYKGYHQIQLAEPDEEKTAFHTGQGVYCYTKMSFGLKNAGATYQRLMDKAFESQIIRNIEINMKLNPKKCSFGLAEGVFLGYVVTPEGIKPCSDKTAAVLQLPLPRTIKEVQSLNGKLAGLNIFLSKAAEKSLPLFKTLKKCIKKSNFHWTAEVKQAFKQLKQHLSELPLSVAPKPKEELIIYLSATHGAISAVLMTEKGTVQTPIYFIIRALQGLELNYTPMEKLVLSLVFAAKRLWWPITSVKGHILADFLIEIPSEYPQAAPAAETQQEPWTLFTDGSSSSNNEAEYEALIAGLRIAARMGVKNVQLRALVQTSTGRSTQRQIHKRKGGGNSDRGGRTDLDDTDSGLFKRRNSPRRQEGGKKAPPQGPTIRVNGGNSLQAVIPYAVVKMCWTAPGGIHRPITRSPQQPLTPITAPWPFYKRRIDIAGPFLEGPGKVKFLIVAMDYFTKWIEAKAVATITGSQVKKFVWDNIVCRFGIPVQQTRRKSEPKSWRRNQGPPGGHTHRDWNAYVLYHSSRRGKNVEELRLNLDLLEERRKRAAICEAKTKSKMTKYYNARVRGVTFRPGDLVYRSKDASHAVAGGKLGPKWEGPYEVTEGLGDGAYKLRSMDGTILPRTWNIANLKRCYL
nr:reverse transcriptase domain-containing protein [Tanacetum cinerariifolium]